MSELRFVDERIELQRITPAGDHCFFGYYDVPPLTGAGRHLCHRVPFRDRLPDADDQAELGTVSLDGVGEFVPFATTTTWNFQQGAMLQRLGGTGDRIIYNTRTTPIDAGAVIHDLTSGALRTLPRPVANVSRDGQWGLSISFARMFTFRPGYGYASVADEHFREDQPAGDGIWLMDLTTGESKLVLSLAEMGRLLREVAEPFRGRLLANHVTLNPSASRFVALVRNYPASGSTRWSTAILTAQRDGSDVRLIGRGTSASHYWWVDDTTLLFWCDGPEGMQHYVVRDVAVGGAFEAVDPPFFLADGHMSTSPDGRWLIYDSYPDRERTQHLWLYDLERKRGVKLARLETLAVPVTDLRCDLHPRWLTDGRRLTIDSTFEGYRGTYLLDVSAVMKAMC
jgi:hypothetical protein